jgi:transcriptional regulator with XRE-family HTH domain
VAIPLTGGIRSDTIGPDMDAGAVIRNSRHRAHATLRGLASRAGTSHSALAAYESGRKEPAVATLDRIVRSSGYDLVVELRPGVGGNDESARGRELAAVLELAAQFPARHSPTLDYPRFGPK